MVSETYRAKPFVPIAKSSIIAVVILVAIFQFREALSEFFLPIMGAVIFLAMIKNILIVIKTRERFIRLEENALVYGVGLLSMKEYIMPYNKITEANYTQSIIERIFGLGTLKVDSPGGTDTPVVLPYAAKSDVNRILEVIKTKTA